MIRVTVEVTVVVLGVRAPLLDFLRRINFAMHQMSPCPMTHFWSNQN